MQSARAHWPDVAVTPRELVFRGRSCGRPTERGARPVKFYLFVGVPRKRACGQGPSRPSSQREGDGMRERTRFALAPSQSQHRQDRHQHSSIQRRRTSQGMRSRSRRGRTRTAADCCAALRERRRECLNVGSEPLSEVAIIKKNRVLFTASGLSPLASSLALGVPRARATNTSAAVCRRGSRLGSEKTHHCRN